MSEPDWVLGLLGVEPEDIPVAVFDNDNNFVCIVSYDEYHGIIEGEYQLNDGPGIPYSNTLEKKQ
jgi:hypothetical protein